MSFKIVKNNAAYGYADLINTDHVTLSSDAKTMFSRRELRIGGKTVEDVDNMAVEKVVDTLMNYSLEYEKTAGSNQFIYPHLTLSLRSPSGGTVSLTIVQFRPSFFSS